MGLLGWHRKSGIERDIHAFTVRVKLVREIATGGLAYERRALGTRLFADHWSRGQGLDGHVTALRDTEHESDFRGRRKGPNRDGESHCSCRPEFEKMTFFHHHPIDLRAGKIEENRSGPGFFAPGEPISTPAGRAERFGPKELCCDGSTTRETDPVCHESREVIPEARETATRGR